MSEAPVLVGIDGSVRSLDAVLCAASAAAARGRPLRIVYAHIWPLLHQGTPPGVPRVSAASLAEQAENDLAEAARVAASVSPDLVIGTALIPGAAAPVLISESRHAELLVLGDRGLGAFSGMIIGSIAVQAATHAHCPVLVVRGVTRDSGPVVAGVDGSAMSAAAIEFSAAEAVRRGTHLVALHAYTDVHPYGSDPETPPGHKAAVIEEGHRQALTETIAATAARFPELTIRHEAVNGSAGRLLTERSQEAQLVVVGSRGRGGFTGLVLGSVSQHLVYHAECPVAVVRPALVTTM